MPSLRQVRFRLAKVSHACRPSSLRVPPDILLFTLEPRPPVSLKLLCRGVVGLSKTNKRRSFWAYVKLRRSLSVQYGVGFSGLKRESNASEICSRINSSGNSL